MFFAKFESQLLALTYTRLLLILSWSFSFFFVCELWLEPQLVYSFFPAGKCAEAIHAAIISSGQLNGLTLQLAVALLGLLEVLGLCVFLTILCSKLVLTFRGLGVRV